MRIFIAFCLLFISIFTLGLYGAGSHGHIMFRPGALEDWIFWSIILFSGLGGMYILAKTFLSKHRK